VVDKAKKETPSPVAVALANGPNGNLDQDGRRAKVIMTKVRLVEAFPMSYAEVNTPVLLNTFVAAPSLPKSHFAKYQAALKGLSSGAPGESAACLLLALKTLKNDGVSVEDQIKFAISNTDGVNPISTLVDAWGNPFVFYRFPSNNANLQAANPALGGNAAAERFSDPADPQGTLLNPGWYGSTATFANNYPIVAWRTLTVKQVYEGTFHPIARSASPAKANYIVPVIVSAGKDGQLGLASPDMSISAAGAEKDNIYSYNQKGD